MNNLMSLTQLFKRSFLFKSSQFWIFFSPFPLSNPPSFTFYRHFKEKLWDVFLKDYYILRWIRRRRRLLGRLKLEKDMISRKLQSAMFAVGFITFLLFWNFLANRVTRKKSAGFQGLVIREKMSFSILYKQVTVYFPCQSVFYSCVLNPA